MRACLSCFLSFSVKLISKLSLPVSGEILAVFVNTLTAVSKHPVQGCENFPLQIQMHLSKKQRTFSEPFLHFLNLHQILNILKKKMIVIANGF